MTLATLRAAWPAYREWWARRPSLTRQPDMTTPEAVAHGVPGIKLPRAAQLFMVKAPQDTVERTLAHMEALERGYPRGGGSVVVTLVRDVPKNGDRPQWWTTLVVPTPPADRITRRPGPGR